MKYDYKNMKEYWWSLILILNFAWAMPMAWADPPPWAPAHGYWAHRGEHDDDHDEGHHRHWKKHTRVYGYTYYPSSQVYYSPVVRKYYYLNNGAWTESVSAPLSIKLGKGISINLGGPVPYVYHPTVIQQYPVLIVP